MSDSSARQDVARVQYWPGGGARQYNNFFLHLTAYGFNIVATKCTMFDRLLQQPSDSECEVVYHICNSIQRYLRPFYGNFRDISWGNTCGPNAVFVVQQRVIDGMADALQGDMRSFHRRHSSRLMLIDTAKIFMTDWKSESLFNSPHESPIGMSYHCLVYFKFKYDRVCTAGGTNSAQDLHVAIETTGPRIFEFHVAPSLAALREMIECKYRCDHINITRDAEKTFYSDFEEFVELPGPACSVDDGNPVEPSGSGGRTTRVQRARASESGGARVQIRNDYERVNAAARRRTPAAIYEPCAGGNAGPLAGARRRARRQRAARRVHGQLHRARRAVRPHRVGRVRAAAVVQRPRAPAGDARRPAAVRLGAHHALQVQQGRVLARGAVGHAVLLHGDVDAGDTHVGGTAQDRGAAGTRCLCAVGNRKDQCRSRAACVFSAVSLLPVCCR